MNQIENYKDLKDAVQVWLNRKDSATVNNIPMFINFAEKQLTRLVKLPYYETTAIFTADLYDYTLIPQNFLSAKSVSVNGKPFNRLGVESFNRIKTSKTADAIIGGGSTSSKINYFARKGDQFHFIPSLVKGDRVEIIYHRDIPEMLSDTDQPYSLTIAPDLMLYLSLRHATIFLRDNEQEQYWMSKAQEAADSLTKQLESAEWDGSSLVVPYFDE